MTTRRRFLRDAGVVGAATAGAMAVGPVPARAASGGRVAVLGAGVAGLTAAHELIERGFEVEVYERTALGGKARSIFPPGTGTGGRLDLPGEHGFRFFPGFYFNLTDTMRRTPFRGNAKGAWDNLVRADAYMMSRQGRPDLTIPFPFPLPPESRIYDTNSFLATITSGLQTIAKLSLTEAAFAAQKLLVYVTSCDERKLGQWENITWADYIRADRFSDEYNKFIADGTIRNLAATKSKDASTHSIAMVGEATVWSIIGLGNEPGGSLDRVLNGSSSEMWLDPWIAHLRDLGVKFNVGYEVTSLSVSGGRIASAGVKGKAPISADWFVVAMPCERVSGLLSDAVLSADPSLAGIKGLRTDWMTGLQFFLKKKLPLAAGHVNYGDSTWAVTSISQEQFWKRDFSTYGDGTVQDCLSSIISDWFTPGTFNKKRATDCLPDEIAAETWKQIKAHLNDTGVQLTDADLHSWFLDPAIVPNGSGGVTNDTPLFIQQPGSWKLRPNSGTKIPNLFLAGDWVKTPINVTTMEGANQGGRQAVNALLDAAGSNAARCDVHELFEQPLWAPFKANDKIRYALRLPHQFDVLDTRWPGR